MACFELKLHNRRVGETWPVVARWTTSEWVDSHAQGQLALDLKALATASPDAVWRKPLGRAVFRDGVRDPLPEGQGLRQPCCTWSLSMEADDLRTLRWDSPWPPLLAPGAGGVDRWSAAVLDRQVPLAVHVAEPERPPVSRPITRSRPPAALIVVANPPESNDFGLDRFDEARRRRGRGRRSGRPPPRCPSPGPPTLDALCKAIVAGAYPLLHVFAHGLTVAEVGEPLLYLLKADGTADPGPGVAADRPVARTSRAAPGCPTSCSSRAATLA